MITVASTIGDRRCHLLDGDPEPDVQRDRMRPEPPHGPGERRAPRATGLDVQPRLREGGRGQLVAALTVGQPVGRRAYGVHVDDARLPGTKHGPHPGQPGDLGGIRWARTCRGLRVAAATSPVMNRTLARSRPLASAFEGSASHRCASDGVARDPAARPSLALLDGDIRHRPTDPPSVGIPDRDRRQDDERDDHPGRPWHGLEDAGQPGDGDHGDREDRARRDVTISRAGVPDRTTAR